MTATVETDRLGTLTGPREVTFTRLLPGPIERVWSFLTEGEKRKLWLGAGEMEPREGGRFTLVFHNEAITPAGETITEARKAHAGVIEETGRVIRWDPPRGLAFTWFGEPGEASEVSFDLAEAGEKVRLTLVHRRLRDHAGTLGVCGGWHAHLGVLEAILEGRAPDRFWSVVDEVEPIYARDIPDDA